MIAASFTASDRSLVAVLLAGLMATILLAAVESHVLCDLFCLHEALAVMTHDICAG